ncbi:hypothetical protein [Cupriavidus necator]|uniref:hypothetical protein n=1 Tax=Cupriavidus necator TaxID=106590 RepID=UPI00339D557F
MMTTPATTPADGVTDEQVDAALDAFNAFPCPMYGGISRSWNKDQMRAAIAAALATPSPGKAPEPVAHYCEHKHRCKWPGASGSPAWGKAENQLSEWRKWHENKCGGRLLPLYASPGKAEAERAEWMACESRRPWAANSLAEKAKEMRGRERLCRNSFRKEYMGEPARYVADAYGEAAAVFEARLAAIQQERDTQ